MAQVRNSRASGRPLPSASSLAGPKGHAARGSRPAGKTRSGPAPAAAGRRRWTMLFEEGDATMRDLLGGKGAGLAEMSRIGLPVPPGFTITTEACLEYYRRSRQFPAGLLDDVRQG